MAYVFYMKVKGVKSGIQLPGESKKPSRTGWLELKSFEYGIATPVDANDGQPAGQRTHKPIVITKEIGAASPLLFTMSVNKEVLDVVIEAVDARPATGPETVVSRISLTNGSIVRVEQYGTNGNRYTIVYENLQTTGTVLPFPPK